MNELKKEEDLNQKLDDLLTSSKLNNAISDDNQRILKEKCQEHFDQEVGEYNPSESQKLP